jgi:hypothetical protein
MAVWQFDLHLVPRAVAASNPGSPASELKNTAWAQATLPTDYQVQLDAIAPRTKSWSPKVEMWGVEDGSRITVWWIDGRVSSVWVRLDARDPSPAFAEAVLDLARRWDCVLLARGGELMDPEMEKLGPALALSSAAQFVLDPRGYLAKLAAKHSKS